MIKEHFAEIIDAARRGCFEHYRGRLISLAVFGSAGRGTMRPDSDIDLLLVVADLPRGRMARIREFSPVEERVSESLQRAEAAGVFTTLAPVFKTPEEVRYGSPLFLDMTQEIRILYDRGAYLARYLESLRQRLTELGAKRIARRGGYYWLLKPDLKPGEEFAL